ncbi:MAG: hypothetical protein ABSD71_08400 [Bacteroidales bacterium]|jgi:hypothetical protein
MKTKALILISLLLVTFSVKSQDCSSAYFPSKEGTKIEMTNYDKNGQVQGKTVTTIVFINKSGGATIINLRSETNTRNNSSSMDYTAKCDGNNFSVSMKSFVPSSMQKSASGGEMTIDASDLIYPNSLSIGKKLSDGSVTMNMTMGTMAMKTVINITNRTVTGRESITTPSGTYDCYKIEYDVETTVMNMKVKSRVKQWVTKGIGTIKTENYNDKGELMGYTEVTSIK